MTHAATTFSWQPGWQIPHKLCAAVPAVAVFTQPAITSVVATRRTHPFAASQGPKSGSGASAGSGVGAGGGGTEQSPWSVRSASSPVAGLRSLCSAQSQPTSASQPACVDPVHLLHSSQRCQTVSRR